MLRSARHRETAIRSLLFLAESYDGLHLDFEHLGGEDLEYLEMLLLELYPEMTARKKTLSLAVLPGNFPLLKESSTTFLESDRWRMNSS